MAEQHALGPCSYSLSSKEESVRARHAVPLPRPDSYSRYADYSAEQTDLTSV